MAGLTTDFATNFTEALNAIVDSKIYTDIKSMYDNGTLQKDQHEKILIAFHEKALGVAGTITENITVKGYRLDNIIEKDLELKTKDVEYRGKQILTETQRKLLLEAQTRGFDDNVVLEFAKFVSENIGMIESGGNTSPQALWDLWTVATNDVKTISQKHSELTQ